MAGGAAAAGQGLGLPGFSPSLVSASVPALVRADQGPARVSVLTGTSVSRLTVRVNGRSYNAVRTVRDGRLRWQVTLPRTVLAGGANAVTIVAHAGRRWGVASASFQYLYPRSGLVTVLSPKPRATMKGTVAETFTVMRGATVYAWLNGRSEGSQVAPADEVLVAGRLRLHFVAGKTLGTHIGANRLVVIATKGRFYTRVVRVVRVRGGGSSGGGSPTEGAPQSLVQIQTEAAGGTEIQVGDQHYKEQDFALGSDDFQVLVLDRSTLQLIGDASFNNPSLVGEYITQEQQHEADPIVILQTGQHGGIQHEVSEFNAVLRQIGVSPVDDTMPSVPNGFVAIGGPELPPGTGTHSCVLPPPVTGVYCAVDGYLFSPVGAGVTGNYIFEPGQYVNFNLGPTAGGTANTITVGDDRYSSGPPAGGNGYHVLVLDRYTLAPQENSSYATGSAQSEAASEALLAADLTKWANNPNVIVLMTNEGAGLPVGLNTDPTAANEILAAISKLGGTPDVFARSVYPYSYSLVGIGGDVDYGDVDEASSDSPEPGEPPSAEIYGVLARSMHTDAFEPLEDSPTPLNTAVFTAIFRPSTPWPDSNDPGYAGASAYIANRLFPNAGATITNVRDTYDNRNLAFGDALAKLAIDSSSIQAGCAQNNPAATCANLISDYANEFPEVDEVRNFFTGIEKPILDEAADNFVELNAIETAISNAVQPPPPSTKIDVSDILGVVGDVANLVGLGPLVSATDLVKKVATAGTVLSGLLATASASTALATNELSQGGAAQSDIVQTTAGKLETTIAENQSNLFATVNNLEDATLTDAGRLAAVDGLAETTDTTGGEINQVAADYLTSLKREFTTALVTANWTFSSDHAIPVSPPIWYTRPDDNYAQAQIGVLRNMESWNCGGVKDENYHPYGLYPPSTEYAPITRYDTNPVPQQSFGVPQQSVFFVVTAHLYSHGDSPTSCDLHWPIQDFASGAVFTAMFEPLGQQETVNGNTLDSVALIPSQWWWRNFAGAKCWLEQGNPAYDVPECAPSPTTFVPAAAWTYPTSP